MDLRVSIPDYKSSLVSGNWAVVGAVPVPVNVSS